MRRASARVLGAAPRGSLAARRSLAATPSGSIKAPIGWGALAVMGAAGGGLATYYNMEKEKRQTAAAKKQTTYGVPSLGGPWTLVDSADGSVVTDASFRGDYVLMYFGFSKCPDICPAELVKMGEVLARLDAKAGSPRVKPLFVSLDPRTGAVRTLVGGFDYAKQSVPVFQLALLLKSQLPLLVVGIFVNFYNRRCGMVRRQ